MNDIDHVDDSEVIFTIIEGVEDYIAVIPTSTWVTAPYTLTYGLDTLNSRVPVWMSPFMVHNDQIAETVERLARVAISIDGNSDYICPTTSVRLEEWYPKSTTEPRVCAETPLAYLEASQERSIEFWDEVEEHNCEVHINPAQPGVHDFYVSHRATGWLRFEEKKAPSFFQMLDIAQSLDPRHDPLAAFRTWHVFYLHTPPGPVCITRNELEQLQGKRPSEDFVKDYTFNGFADAWQHILKHAEEAKRSVQRVLATLTPTDISASLPKREMVLFKPKHDPLSAMSGAQTTLSWLSR
ncbi:hypothetical protein KC318_g85 [Hortaea werneckii]|nr:hypothetical protein KC334_g76 [Hortaea werneckii]KAI7028065.1 hypothetical protein KC355_g84 [Hortaea werneckii]KAI7203845.1 hypothetical protein KC324_g1044 [Hortaea werneckii]KAI7594959.1 hypothetical protein KC316_g837 [Hortaea werneckii]KAI7676725.1 hypothetical protein KC318_g85 [Hortaea werneckii]